MALAPQPITMTLEEFLALEPGQPVRYEFSAGELVAMAGASRAHGTIATNLVALLHAAARRRGCGLYAADMKVVVPAIPAVRYPDLVVTCDSRDLADLRVTRSPMLLVEIVSSSTEALDRGAKFAEYREIETLAEFVLVDSRTVHIETFRRRDGYRWLFEEYGPGAVLTLESVDCDLHVDAVYEGVRLSRSMQIVIEGD